MSRQHGLNWQYNTNTIQHFAVITTLHTSELFGHNFFENNGLYFQRIKSYIDFWAIWTDKRKLKNLPKAYYLRLTIIIHISAATTRKSAHKQYATFISPFIKKIKIFPSIVHPFPLMADSS